MKEKLALIMLVILATISTSLAIDVVNGPVALSASPGSIAAGGAYSIYGTTLGAGLPTPAPGNVIDLNGLVALAAIPPGFTGTAYAKVAGSNDQQKTAVLFVPADAAEGNVVNLDLGYTGRPYCADAVAGAAVEVDTAGALPAIAFADIGNIGADEAFAVNPNDGAAPGTALGGETDDYMFGATGQLAFLFIPPSSEGQAYTTGASHVDVAKVGDDGFVQNQMEVYGTSNTRQLIDAETGDDGAALGLLATGNAEYANAISAISVAFGTDSAGNPVDIPGQSISASGSLGLVATLNDADIQGDVDTITAGGAWDGSNSLGFNKFPGTENAYTTIDTSNTYIATSDTGGAAAAAGIDGDIAIHTGCDVSVPDELLPGGLVCMGLGAAENTGSTFPICFSDLQDAFDVASCETDGVLCGGGQAEWPGLIPSLFCGDDADQLSNNVFGDSIWTNLPSISGGLGGLGDQLAAPAPGADPINLVALNVKATAASAWQTAASTTLDDRAGADATMDGNDNIAAASTAGENVLASAEDTNVHSGAHLAHGSSPIAANVNSLAFETQLAATDDTTNFRANIGAYGILTNGPPVTGSYLDDAGSTLAMKDGDIDANLNGQEFSTDVDKLGLTLEWVVGNKGGFNIVNPKVCIEEDQNGATTFSDTGSLSVINQFSDAFGRHDLQALVVANVGV